jgi:hypothetical protein
MIYLSVTPRPEPISQIEKRNRNAIAIHAVVIEAAVPLIVTRNQTSSYEADDAKNYP